MPPRKDDAPRVVTYADHEVITPPNALRRAIAPVTAGLDDPIGRAELALRGLSPEFSKWMRSECERLEKARREVKRAGFTEQSHDGLFRAAHDIKGEAATFGFAEVAGVAESLCRLLEHTPQREKIPKNLVDQHVDAVRAIVREHTRPDVTDVAVTLTQRLREVTDDFLRRENSFRPDYLKSIFSPPLAPGLADM